MTTPTSHLVARTGDLRWAVPVEIVDEVVAAVLWTPLAGAPADTVGVVDVRGAPVRLHDPSVILGAGPRAITTATRYVLLTSPRGRVALAADEVVGLESFDADDEPTRNGDIDADARLRAVHADGHGLTLLLPIEEVIDRSGRERSG